MLRELRSLIAGIAQLRHADVVASLGRERQRLLQLTELTSMAPGIRVSDSVILLGFAAGRLDLATGVHVREGTILAFGDDSEGFGSIRIGQRTWIGQYNNLRASGHGSIRIGANCLIAQFCTLVGSQHARERGRLIIDQGADAEIRGVTLGDDVWLGAGVVVTPGVTINDGAVIGANAVVTHDVPSQEIWAGVPARKIGERS